MSDGADFDRSAPTRKRRAAPQRQPGVWDNCAAGAHRLCAVEVLAQAAWASAGRAPPAPDAPPTTLERCACACHARK